jgi:hypothetical protein
MKNILPVFLSILFCIQVQAQDTIYFHRNEKEVAKILEINPTEIVYRKMSYLDGPMFRSLKADIDSIRFANGLKEVFGTDMAKSNESLTPPSTPPAARTERESYAMGVSDADQYYRGHKGIGTASYISGLFGLYGFPIPLVGSLVRPTNMMRYVPDVKRYNTDTPYFNGFNSRAKTIKSNKAWSNYGYGAATTAGVILIFVVAVLTTVN